MSQIIGNLSYVQYDNYFISNNSRFLTIGSYYNGINTFTILSLDTNKSIFFYGYSSAYYLSLINRFSDSPDVYFSLSNETMFFFVKYNFTNNDFSIIYHTNNSNAQIEIPVTVLQQNDRIIASVNTFDQNSQLITLNENGLTSTKTFSFSISYFTPYGSNGFLFYTAGTNYLESDNRTSVFYDYSNLKILKAFDNNTFLGIGTNFMNVYHIKTSTLTTSIQKEFSYTINYQNDLYLPNLFQAFNVNGTKYYLYENQYSYGSQNNIVINHYYDYPTNYNQIITSSSTIGFKTQNYYTTFYSNPTSSSSNLGTFLIFVFIFMIIIGVIVVSLKKNKTLNQYYSPRNNSYLQRNHYNQHYQQQQSLRKRINVSCSHCGSKAELGDIFCQNCGTRL